MWSLRIMVSKVRNDVSCCGKDSSRYQGKWIFYKIDIDISKEIAEYIGIEIVPTFVVYRDGKISGIYNRSSSRRNSGRTNPGNVKKIIGGINYSYDEYFAQIALTCYVKIRIQQHRMAEDRNQMNMVFHHIPVSLLYICRAGFPPLPPYCNSSLFSTRRYCLPRGTPTRYLRHSIGVKLHTNKRFFFAPFE